MADSFSKRVGLGTEQAQRVRTPYQEFSQTTGLSKLCSQNYIIVINVTLPVFYLF